jgi:outer membrane lipoprotein SlyB
MNQKILLLLPTLFLASCASDIGRSSYSTSSVGRAQTTLTGVILKVTPVRVKDTEGINPGAPVGALAGAALGATVASDKYKPLAGALAGIAGGTAGHFVGKKLKDQDGFEYVVQASNGIIYTITQGKDIVLNVGQQVMIVLPDGNNRGRVFPL